MIQVNCSMNWADI